jgi:hypothetical protein
VILFFLPGPPIVITAFTLAIALYLTVVELRELRPHFVWWSWWILLVVLTHFIGYLALRGYGAYRRSHRARPSG